jgi:putative CocE/NonD family hydrolase
VLKGKTTGVLDGPPVKLFIMGGGDGSRTPEGRLSHGGEWTALSHWPPRGGTEGKLFLQSGGRLNEDEPPWGGTPSVFTFDPDDPVPTIGGKVSSGNNVSPAGPFDQRCVQGKFFPCENDLPLSSRRDVLVFQTDPLEEDVTVVGPVTVTLWFASSARDTDFTAKLVDVYPPNEDYPSGYDFLVADSIVRARFRNALDSEAFLKPGEVYSATIDLMGTANRFRKGHRIRVDISSSNFPFYDVNPNTGERPAYHTKSIKAVNTVYHDRERASHITLSLLADE